MNKEPETLVGLDIGTTKIAVVVAERDPRSQSAQIIGIGMAPANGIRKGLIVNLDQAVRSVRKAARDAENMVGLSIDNATVSFSGTDVHSVMSRGMISLGRAAPRPVTVSDIERVIEAAQSELAIPANMFALHTIPVKYSIDSNTGIDDPLGMTGVRLEMELQTIVVPTTVAQNIVNCVENAGINVSGLVVKPLASALGALTRDEMDAGVISLCIGGGTTGVAFYSEGRPIKVSVIPIGGDHITNDLAYVLRLPISKAEDLKRRLFTESNEPDELDIELLGKNDSVSPDTAVEVVTCRLEELFVEHVSPMLTELGASMFPAGVVLSGGVARTPGIDALVSDILKLPVRVADPLDYYQMPPRRNDSSYVNATGIVRYVLNQERNPYSFMETPVSQLRGTYRPSSRFSGNGKPRGVGEAGDDGSARGSGNIGVFMDRIKKTIKELF